MSTILGETDKLIWNAISCKSLNERVRQRCLDKRNLIIETAIDITKDGMQLMSAEDPRVQVHKLGMGNGSSRRPKKQGKQKTPKWNNEQPQKCDRGGYNDHKPQEKCPARNDHARRARKLTIFAEVRRCEKSNVNFVSEMDYPGEVYSRRKVLAVMCNYYM